MRVRATFAYGQARVQARFGQLTDDATWRRLARIGDFGQALQVAQGTSLQPWLEHLGPGSGPHEVALALRLRYRQHVNQVAGWFPRAWQPSIEWVKAAADRAIAAHLLAGRAPLPWMRHDPWYRTLVSSESADRAAVLRGSPLAPLVGTEPVRVSDAWRRHWRELRPAVSGQENAELERIGMVFVSAIPASGEAVALQKRFRRGVMGPIAVFAYLAMVTREMERLRGLLQQRRLLPREAWVA